MKLPLFCNLGRLGRRPGAGVQCRTDIIHLSLSLSSEMMGMAAEESVGAVAWRLLPASLLGVDDATKHRVDVHVVTRTGS